MRKQTQLLSVLAMLILLFPLFNSLATAAQPKLEGLSPDFIMKGSFKGGVTTLKGDFLITWEDYTISGALGEINRDDKGNFISLKVTLQPRVVEQGDNPLELVCDSLDMHEANERITAIGNVLITTKELKVNANHLEGGRPAGIADIIKAALHSFSLEVQNDVNEWLAAAAPTDQIFLLQGTVAGNTSEIRFDGDFLLVNATTENFVFAGPANITYISQEDEGTDNE